jgi:hypothetical protein
LDLQVQGVILDLLDLSGQLELQVPQDQPALKDQLVIQDRKALKDQLVLKD